MLERVVSGSASSSARRHGSDLGDDSPASIQTAGDGGGLRSGGSSTGSMLVVGAPRMTVRRRRQLDVASGRRGDCSDGIRANGSREQAPVVIRGDRAGSEWMERATRIELALSAWEAEVLPLNYARKARSLYPPLELRPPQRSVDLVHAHRDD